MAQSRTDGAAGAPDDVLITEALARRVSRPPDFEAEAGALGALARELATNPRGLLQAVVETARTLCRADSAGVSVLEPGGEHGLFRWQAAVGPFAANLHGTMPRETSPCGDVVRRNAVLLFDRPARSFPALRGVEPPIYESLLAPWEIDGAPAGTLWLIAHTPERHFDAEDARLLASLARFAAAGWQMVLARDAAEAGRATQEQRAEARVREAAETSAELRHSETRLQLALDVAELGTWEWSLLTGAGDLDVRGAAMVGLPAGPLADVARAQAAVIHPDDLAATQAAAAAGVASGGAFDLAYRVVRPDGSVRHIASRARALTDAAGRPARLVGTNRDVTAEREADAALREALAEVERRVATRTSELAAANAALAAEVVERARIEAARDALRRQLTSAEEAERRRLARELHDQLGQHLTAFTWGLDEARRLTLADVEAHSRLAQRLGQLQELASAMTRDARYLALELRPPELDDVGLESALATYVEQWSARYGVPADVAITGLTERRIPGDVGTALYRIVQEALTNVAKHAQARQVSVIVEKPDGEVRLIVEDDGLGFDVETTLARAHAERRLGLAGMRERAALIGGTLTVESTPGGGTSLYVRLRLHDGAAAPDRSAP